MPASCVPIINRRSVLLGSLISAALGTRLASASVPGLPSAGKRLIVLEHRYVEHALSLGIAPVGVADLGYYLAHVGVGAAALAHSRTASVGLRQEPNLEEIGRLAPDLIVGVRFRHSPIRERLSAIAPTTLFDYTDVPADGPDQFVVMLDELRSMGSAVDRTAEAEAAIAAFQTQLDSLRQRVADAGLSNAPFVFAQFPSGSPFVRLFTDRSVAVELLRRIGLVNAWPGNYERFGFNTVGPEKLVSLRDALFIHAVIGSDSAYEKLTSGPVWRVMPFVKAGHVYRLPNDIWPFGGLTSAARFVELVVDHLTHRK